MHHSDLNTDELKAKRANLERVKEFSRNLHSFNKQSIRQQPKLPPSSEKRGIEISKQKMESRRQKALDFAKKIPKPKASDNTAIQRGVPSELSSYQHSDFDSQEMEDFGDLLMCSDPDAIAEKKLQELEARHQQGKLQIEAIRKTMGLK